MRRNVTTTAAATFAALLAGTMLSPARPALARLTVAPEPMLSTGFSPLSYVSPANIRAQVLHDAKQRTAINTFCQQVASRYKHYQWKDDACGKVHWRADLLSKGGHPLVYAAFGHGKETTILLGGVHPDEVTPVPIAFRMARYLDEHPEVVRDDVRVVIAPLVNPDGFLREVPTRTNLNGIDLNRNFFTIDWYGKARNLWLRLREGSPKHFPGHFPNSEVETIFQITLIDNFHPDKILSIHAPLGFLDYDGPGDGELKRPLTTTEQRAKRLVKSISERSQNYRVVDYTFYPGSLGNYAGNERQIPTVTLELKTTAANMVDTYWRQFLPGLLQSIHYPFRLNPMRAEGQNATPFSAEYAEAPKDTI